MNVNTHKQISTLQEELTKMKAMRDEMQKYIRELEQKNDDLERTNRYTIILVNNDANTMKNSSLFGIFIINKILERKTNRLRSRFFAFNSRFEPMMMLLSHVFVF